MPLQQLDDPPHERPGTNFHYGTRLPGLPLWTRMDVFFCFPFPGLLFLHGYVIVYGERKGTFACQGMLGHPVVGKCKRGTTEGQRTGNEGASLSPPPMGPWKPTGTFRWVIWKAKMIPRVLGMKMTWSFAGLTRECLPMGAK